MTVGLKAHTRPLVRASSADTGEESKTQGVSQRQPWWVHALSAFRHAYSRFGAAQGAAACSNATHRVPAPAPLHAPELGSDRAAAAVRM